MIAGRNPALWVGLLQAVLNLAAAAWVIASHAPLTGDDVALLAGLNAVGVALVGLVANESDPTTVGTFAPTLRAPAVAATVQGATTGAPSGAQPTATASPTTAPTDAATPPYPPA